VTRVGPIGYWLGCYRKYATFSGRARRAEYWWFTLFNVISYAVLLTLGLLIDYLTEGNGIGPGLLIFVYLIGVLLPSLAVACRRLHDVGQSGLWLLVTLIPGGSLVILIFAVLAGNPGPNQYGPDPRQAY